MYKKVVDFIKDIYENLQKIPLHEPRFAGNEKRFVNDYSDRGFVS
jgi:perosamine synthetase